MGSRFKRILKQLQFGKGVAVFLMALALMGLTSCSDTKELSRDMLKVISNTGLRASEPTAAARM